MREAALTLAGTPLRLRDLPPEARPRERLFAHGAAALSLTELLAIILDTGHASYGRSAVDLAALLLARLRGARQMPGLAAISCASPEDLRSVPGIGAAKAARLLAAIELGRRLGEARPERVAVDRPEDVVRWLRPRMRDLDREHFVVLWLDTKHRVLGHETVSIGGLDAAPAHPREVFKGAIVRSAAAVVLAHNHPSGDPTPSADDVRLTRRLVDAGRILGIEVLDHIILGTDRFESLRRRGFPFD
ncbi:MAG: DNA repair protein RadC [Clostridia bacterium]|nr:DNA repair protein RadC [Clostridia bacterium]